MNAGGVIAARLGATRITQMAGPLSGPLPEHYRAWHAELGDRLATRFDDLEPSELFVTCTANAQSELLSGDGWQAIVHDQHLGRTLNRMTYFVLRDWPPSRVQAWAFERLATAALSRGDLEGTQLALGLSAVLSQVDEAPGSDHDLDAARALMVTIQEFFVLAHEVAHTALGETAHASLESHLRDELESSLGRDEQVHDEHLGAIADKMARDVAEAVRRHTGVTASPEDLDRLRRTVHPGDMLDEVAWLRDHRYLYEEMACDLIATELTVDHFKEMHEEIDVRTVLPAILMGLHNLASLEFLATISGADASVPEGTLRAAMMRKSVWRDMTRKMYDAETPAGLGRIYVDLSEDHAHKLGDQILFIVPTIWREAQRELEARRGAELPSEVGGARMRDAVWAFADPG